MTETNTFSIAENYLKQAGEKIPAIGSAIREYGDMPLADYLKTFILKPLPSYQPVADCLEIIQQYASSLFGESAARQTVRELEAYPAALTCNHVGVEYFAQSLQSTILFSMNKPPSASVPVFSCGNIPLNNLTYPQGALIYLTHPDYINQLPIKIPVFSNRSRKVVVSAAPAFNQTMILSAQKRVHDLRRQQQIPASIAETLNMLFEEDYLDPQVLALPNYSQQSAVVNRKIWKRLFAESETVPEIIPLELEQITNKLLEVDLIQPTSLVARVLFDPIIRKTVLELLDGAAVCWTSEKLRERLTKQPVDNWGQPAAGGTVFFWGISPEDEKVSLLLESDTQRGEMLRGLDRRGRLFEFPFNPDAILNAITQQQILPSLFTCFLAVSLARGMVCIGGYFQESYLPLIQQAVAEALILAGDHQSAELVSQTPTNYYLSGMLAIMATMDTVGLVPAGPLEIISSRGITRQDIDQLRRVTISQAHLAGLWETIPNVILPELLKSGWKQELAVSGSCLPKNSIIIK